MADVWANSMACHPEPRITLQGAATWWIYCHDSRATCHIAGCKNSIRHIKNRFSPYIIFFKCSLGFDDRRLSYRLRYTSYVRILATDGQTNRQTDGQLQSIKSQARYRERRLNKPKYVDEILRQTSLWCDKKTQIHRNVNVGPKGEG